MPVGGPPEAGQLSVATGRRALSLASTRPLQLLVLSSSLPPTPRVVSQPSIAAKSAALLVCLTPVGAERGQSLLVLSSFSGLSLGS